MELFRNQIATVQLYISLTKNVEVNIAMPTTMNHIILLERAYKISRSWLNHAGVRITKL